MVDFGDDFSIVCLGVNIASNIEVSDFLAIKSLLGLVNFSNSCSIDILVDNNRPQFKKKEVESERIEIIFILNAQKTYF